ncbi:phage virion morphogenesis protein [Rhizobium sp. CFBP 8762]|uniref:phage virion morphogenesis protein n=1 Tax=Rhizobium sp. CFBP 8762 TaxID=2775279 RepID=UPI001782B417|nr:phage virion morphogenesis protein [Rhizobium sp. CFBP 8762]MBD8554910.1 phage virion morphogenesis protein [Rhizobium sp. CFBP 8762]
MSGASISVTTEVLDGDVRRAFTKLQQAMDDTTPVMDAIGVGLAGSTHMRFVTQSGPDGQAWQALNTDYAQTKRNSRILTESGRLRDSINRQAGNDYVRVGTNVVYAAIHQFGGTIKPKTGTHLHFRIGGQSVMVKSVTLPARPFLGISTDDTTMIAETVYDFLERHATPR